MSRSPVWSILSAIGGRHPTTTAKRQCRYGCCMARRYGKVPAIVAGAKCLGTFRQTAAALLYQSRINQPKTE